MRKLLGALWCALALVLGGQIGCSSRSAEPELDIHVASDTAMPDASSLEGRKVTLIACDAWDPYSRQRVTCAQLSDQCLAATCPSKELESTLLDMCKSNDFCKNRGYTDFQVGRYGCDSTCVVPVTGIE